MLVYLAINSRRTRATVNVIKSDCPCHGPSLLSPTNVPPANTTFKYPLTSLPDGRTNTPSTNYCKYKVKFVHCTQLFSLILISQLIICHLKSSFQSLLFIACFLFWLKKIIVVLI